MTYEFTSDQVAALIRHLPEGATGPLSGFNYTDGVLTVPFEMTSTVAAIVASTGWEDKSPPDVLLGYLPVAQARVLAEGKTVNVAASGPAINVFCDGTNETRADLAMLALFGQTFPSETKTWLDNNGHATELSGSQFVALAIAIGAWIDSTYSVRASLASAINAMTVTSNAAVDAAFAAA